MQERKLTQGQVAKQVGFSQTSVGHWLTGHDIKLSTYERILKVYPELRDDPPS